MDIVTRLIVLLCLGFVSFAVTAQPRTWGTGKETETKYKCQYFDGYMPTAAACGVADTQQIITNMNSGGGMAASISNIQNGCYSANGLSQTCWGKFNFQFNYQGAPLQQGGHSSNYSGQETSVCPSNSSEVQTTGPCTCHTGFEVKLEPGGKTKCVPYTCPASGSYSSVTQPDTQLAADGDACYQGCAVKPSSVKSSPDGKLWAVWPFISRGKACGGADPVTKDVTFKPKETGPAAPVACGPSKCPGTVNGAHVCVPCSGVTVPGVSTSASGISNTTPGGPNLPDGGTSTSNTTCNQSTCITTTTVTDKNGNPVGTASQEKPKESFCQENPQLSICKDGRWGGTCGAYTCDGDAVQCALSLQVHKSACEWQQLDPETKAKGEAGLAGGDRPEGHPGNAAQGTALNFSSVISTSDLVGGGSCPSDTLISYAGRSLTIPWSKACDSLQMVGNLAMAVCMLAAAFIVFR